MTATAEKRYHLFRDFGVYKASIRRNYESGDLCYEYPQVGELLKRRTQSYTLAELEELFGFLWTSHDDCVDENSDEYLPIQVYTSRAKIDFGREALKKLKTLSKPDPDAIFKDPEFDSRAWLTDPTGEAAT